MAGRDGTGVTVALERYMASNGNGNGHKPQISISTLVKTTFSGGDPYVTISQLLERKPTGALLLRISQGGIIGVEWEEKNNSKSS